MRSSHPVVGYAVLLWAIAVGAGVAEAVLAVSHAVGSGPVEPGLWANLGFRAVVYGTAALLVVNFARGRRWARTALAVLLSGVGLASMVVPAGLAMLDGQTLAEALSDGGTLGWAFVAVRATHILSVVAATVLMFTPAANSSFGKTKPIRPHALCCSPPAPTP